VSNLKRKRERAVAATVACGQPEGALKEWQLKSNKKATVVGISNLYAFQLFTQSCGLH
jgi:hypothetical protein